MNLATGEKIRRARSTAWRELDGQVAVLSMDINRLRLLNGVGSFVWRICDGRTIDEVATMVAEQYGVRLETIRADVVAFVGDLAARGMIGNEGFASDG